MNFYLSNNGQTVGPYSVDQIRIFLKQGLVTISDLVWADGWTDWMQIGNVPGIGFQPSIQQRDSSASEGSPPEHPLLAQANEAANVQATMGEASSEPNGPSPTVLPFSASIPSAPDRSNLNETPATPIEIAAEKVKGEPSKGRPILAGVCFVLAAVCCVIGASYHMGVQNGAQSGVRESFKQGVNAGAEAQSQQDLQTVDAVAATVNAVRSQDGSSADDSSSPNSANTDTQNSASNPPVVLRPDGTFAPAPQSAPQSFQQ